MKKSQIAKLKTVKDLKRYLQDFNDNDQLSDICIKQIDPTRFNFNVSFYLTLNTDDVGIAQDIVEEKLLNTFGQKIELEDIDCDIMDEE